MSGGGGKKSQEYTTGFWYGIGAHLALCHGPVDAVTEIRVGERLAWSGNVTSSTSIFIDNPTLFGGEEREGGVQGAVDVLLGEATQAKNDYLQSLLGTAIPAFRGVFSLVLKRVWVAAMNPYIKPWSVKARRIPKSWNPTQANIDGDANPAHIIRECLTNRDWGMGYPDTDLDDPSFAAAAQTLYAEGFGLSLLWQQEETIESFVLAILKHIDGVLYVHPRTGLFTLRLARADYVLASQPLFDNRNIARIEEFSRPSWGEVTNQVTVVYRDGATDKDTSVTVQDLAGVQLTGSVVATSVQFPGIAKAELANRVAMRELKQLSSGLAKCTFIANRQASLLNIGDVIRFTWAPYGITQMALRVARLSYGELTDGAVRVECVQDVFGLPQSVYSTPPPTAWTDPVSLPQPCPFQLLYEVPYWSVIKDFTGESQSLIGDIDDFDGLVAACGARSNLDAYGFEARVYEAGAYQSKGFGVFTPTAILTGALPKSAINTVVGITGGIDLADVEIGTLAILDDEWVQVAALNPVAQTVTIERGLLDTVPAAHASGARLWFVDDHRHYITPEYVQGEIARVKLLPRTAKGSLAETATTQLNLTLAKRFTRPYCAGNVLIKGLRYPAAITGELSLSWATRNRQSQTAYLVLQTETSIAPETGQTTTLRFYNENDALVRTITGLTTTSHTWTLTQETSDSGLGRLNGRLRIEIEAERNGHVSWQKHSIEFERAGYGLRYGNYYGGI
jgi:hypothetical protein